MGKLLLSREIFEFSLYAIWKYDVSAQLKTCTLIAKDVHLGAQSYELGRDS